MSPTHHHHHHHRFAARAEAWVWRDASNEGVVAPGSARRR